MRRTRRIISSKSAANKKGATKNRKGVIGRILVGLLVFVVIGSFAPAVRNQVKALNLSMSISDLKDQIEEQKLEKRRLFLIKAEAMDPRKITLAAARLGMVRMSARNIVTETSPVQESDIALANSDKGVTSNRPNEPVTRRASSETEKSLALNSSKKNP